MKINQFEKSVLIKFEEFNADTQSQGEDQNYRIGTEGISERIYEKGASASQQK